MHTKHYCLNNELDSELREYVQSMGTTLFTVREGINLAP